MFSGNKQDRLAFTMFPAARHGHSDGNEVADIDKYFQAIIAK